MEEMMESHNCFKFDFGASAEKTSPTKKGSYPISDYISFMVAVENASGVDATNTQLMLTKYRKLFYNSFGWNDLLVPETKDIAVFPPSTDVDKLSAKHEVILANGDDYDIAHIFAILDASNHNGPFTPVPESIVDSRYWHYLKDIMPVAHDRKMAAGWLGDLSEMAGEFYIRKSDTQAQKQKVIDQFGAYYKTLANVDGLIIAATKADDISASSGKKVSAIFNDYFGSATQAGQREQLKAQIYLDYASAIGLTGWNDRSFANQQDWLAKQKVNLRTCTAFFIIKAKGFNTKAIDLAALKKDLAFLSGHSVLSDLERVFAKFLLDEILDKTTPLDDDLLTLAVCFLTWVGHYDDKLSISELLISYLNGLSQAIIKTKNTD